MATKRVDFELIAKGAGVSSKTVRRLIEEYPFARRYTANKLIDILKMSSSDRKTLLNADPQAGVEIVDNTQTAKQGFKLILPEDFGCGSGLRAEVESLEVACKACRMEWKRLIEINHPDATRAFKTLTELQTQWTNIAKNAPKALQNLDDSVSKAEHQKCLSTVFMAVDRILCDLSNKISKDGEGLDRKKLREVCEKEVEVARDILRTGEVEELKEAGFEETEIEQDEQNTDVE
jgi:hypothetical protein